MEILYITSSLTCDCVTTNKEMSPIFTSSQLSIQSSRLPNAPPHLHVFPTFLPIFTSSLPFSLSSRLPHPPPHLHVFPTLLSIFTSSPLSSPFSRLPPSSSTYSNEERSAGIISTRRVRALAVFMSQTRGGYAGFANHKKVNI